MLLLDTHTLLWWLDDPARLTDAARGAIRDEQGPVFVSAATTWEIAIKRALGKLQAPDDLDTLLVGNGFSELPVTVAHALAAGKLPALHTDPFDRLLVAQAIHEGLTLLTRDPGIVRYPVNVLVA